MALTLQNLGELAQRRRELGEQSGCMRERQGWQWNCSVRTIQNLRLF